MPQLLDKTIEVLKIKYIRGPNMWTWVPVIEAWVDIGDLENFPSDKIPGFYERLISTMPSLIEHRCSYEVRGGFLKRVEEGTWPGHILEHLTLELLGLAGLEVGFGRARETSVTGVYKIIIEAPQEDVVYRAILEAKELLLALIQDRGFDLEKSLVYLKDLVEDLCLGPSTGCIVAAAKENRIPSIRLTKGNLVQLGYGAKQRRIWTAETDQTSAIAESISRDKDLTKNLLTSLGVPVPMGQIVASSESAWEVAQDLGLPVVVKPQDGNHGRGVFTNLFTQEEITSAYEVALQEGSGVIVEKFILGDEHRLLVVGDQVVAAAKGESAWVTGDGIHSVDELIQIQINIDPRRGPTEDFPLNLVRIDSAALFELKRQGFLPEGVPLKGHAVLIQRNGNVSIDVTDQVHPLVAKRVVLAAKIVGLDVAGVDLVIQDISRPLEEQGGAIVEVNAGPGLLMHLKPAQGKPRAVGQAIIKHLFPDPESCRIPLIGITGSIGASFVAEMSAHILKLANFYVGLVSQQGLFFNQRLVEKNNDASWALSRRVVMNRMVTAAVIEATPLSILNEGLAYDLCKIGVITNIDKNIFFPEESINDEDGLFKVFRTQVDVVLPEGTAVLNAQDPMIVEMTDLCLGEIIFYAEDMNHPVLQQRIALNKKIICRQENSIILQEGKQHIWSFDLGLVRFMNNKLAEPIGELMAVIGVCWGLDLDFQLIEAGLETFTVEKLEA